MTRRFNALLVGMAIAVLALAMTGVATAPSQAKKSTVGASSLELDELTTEQFVGQRVIVSYQGHTPPPSLMELIRRGEVAGVIFFGGNIESKGQIRR